MVLLNERLYLDEDCKKKIDKIKEALNTKKILLNVYVIALASNTNEQLDIFSYPMFQIEKRNRDSIVVVGVAKGRDSAMELVSKMSQDAVKSFGKCDIRALFN